MIIVCKLALLRIGTALADDPERQVEQLQDHVARCCERGTIWHHAVMYLLSVLESLEV